MEFDPMVGPGNVRTMTARWVLTGELVLATACHLGGEPEGVTDMVVLRDSLDGGPLLPGTSMAGALRSHMADLLGGYGSVEHVEVAEVFGGARQDDEGTQSPVIVFDSFGALPAESAVELRDGVAIDAASGTAEDHKKFDIELLPPGTVFPIRLEFVIADRKREARLLSLLATALQGLGHDEISLGARRSRGMGALASRNWRAKRFDLGSAAGWIQWLTSDPRAPVAPVERSGPKVREVIAQAFERAVSGAKLVSIRDERAREVADVALTISGSLLVRSPARVADAPDAVQLSSGGKAVLPGTSVAGVMRAHAERIARWVHADWSDDEARKWVENVFGPRLRDTVDPKFKPWASRLRVSERVVTGRRIRSSRIRIDRFTQGVATGALFDEEPVQGGSVALRVELRAPQEGELGLLLLVLKDLIAGHLAIGGGTSVGRGILKGQVTLRLRGRSGPVVLKPEAKLTTEDLSLVDDAIRAFHRATPARGKDRQ